jgi:hypothetical protein
MRTFLGLILAVAVVFFLAYVFFFVQNGGSGVFSEKKVMSANFETENSVLMRSHRLSISQIDSLRAAENLHYTKERVMAMRISKIGS